MTSGSKADGWTNLEDQKDRGNFMSRQDHGGVSDQDKAAKHRMIDAETLFSEGRWRGSMYLGGYAVECLLKCKLMQMFGCHHLYELEDELRRRRILREDQTVFTHQLEILATCAGAIGRIRRNREIRQTFSKVNQWVPAWRYNPDLANHDIADDFISAVRTIIAWIQ